MSSLILASFSLLPQLGVLQLEESHLTAGCLGLIETAVAEFVALVVTRFLRPHPGLRLLRPPPRLRLPSSKASGASIALLLFGLTLLFHGRLSGRVCSCRKPLPRPRGNGAESLAFSGNFNVFSLHAQLPWSRLDALRKGNKANTRNSGGKQSCPHYAFPFAVKMPAGAALGRGGSRDGSEPKRCRCSIAPEPDGRRTAEACCQPALVKLRSRSFSRVQHFILALVVLPHCFSASLGFR